MFKGGDRSGLDGTKDSSALNASSKITKSQVNNLALVIARIQKNADMVEKDVLSAEDLMVIDKENEKKNIPFKHQKEASDCLSEAEGLLKDLYLDLDKAKKMKYPSAGEIEKDVSRLHERWLKDCVLYRDLYKQISEVGLEPRINWIQKEVNSKAYGPTMAELVKQIAAHNLLHKEIEAYNTQLSPDSTTSKEEYAALKKQYANLLDNSQWRRHHLTSLYVYMQSCNKEVAYLSEEQDKILQQDWSDCMVDPWDVQYRYEHFKNSRLLSHESEVNKLQDDGDRLIEIKHPATSTIQSHRDTLRNEWQKFLNLCICQETHLDIVENYKKYQLGAETLSKSLTGLSSTLDPKSLSEKSNIEIRLHLEAEERPLQRSEQLLADLRKRSTTIAPLKLRRTAPNRPTTVESLCDWSTPKASISKGEKFTLISNSNNANWEVQFINRAINSFPGACFLIPPPDTEAIDRVDLLSKELDNLKKMRAAVRTSLKTHVPKSAGQVKSGPLAKPLENPKATELSGRLNQLDKDMGSQVNDLTLLIICIMKNVDMVKKELLKAEDLLVVDAENDKKNIQLKHQKETSECLSEAEGLLKDLFQDSDKAKKMSYHQTREIDKDVNQLHERWLKDCVFYRKLYKQMSEVGLEPRINWIHEFNQKQVGKRDRWPILKQHVAVRASLKTQVPESSQVEQAAMQAVLEKKVFLITTLSADAHFILQHVQQEKIITKREYGNLNNINHTQEKIVTNLLDMVMNKGDVICCKFVALLRQEEIQDNFPKLKQLFIAAPTSYSQENLVSTVSGDDCYPMTRRPLGHCLIVNNYWFEKTSELNNRKGTHADKDALAEVFERMHFLVEERRDLKGSDMRRIVREFSEKDHSNMDAFVCCILSHGEKGTVLGTDGEPVQIRELTQPFALCSALMGKPKLFFIQACQGNELQEGMMEEDGDEYEEDSRVANIRVPVEADFLIGMATVESYKSFRHPIKGSIYMQELCKHLKSGCPKNEDILSILTRVNRSVSAKELKRSKQMPEPRYTLTKKLVLPMD